MLYVLCLLTDIHVQLFNKLITFHVNTVEILSVLVIQDVCISEHNIILHNYILFYIRDRRATLKFFQLA